MAFCRDQDEFQAHIRVDIGKDFPGPIKGSGFIAFSPWILASAYFAFGIAVISNASGTPQPPGFPRFMEVLMIVAEPSPP